jgi:hypothetical protein
LNLFEIFSNGMAKEKKKNQVEPTMAEARVELASPATSSHY